MARLFLLSFLFIASFTLAQDVTISSFPLKKSSLLWKIEGGTASGTSYLFGTMHMIEAEYFYFPKKLERCIKKSDLLVLEVDINQVDQAKLAQSLLLDSGSFIDYFDTLQLDSIYTWIHDKMGVNKDGFLATFGKMKPFVVSQMISQLNSPSNLESYELSITEIANNHTIPLKGLETVEEQMKLFDQMDTTEQANMVMAEIRIDPSTHNMLERLEQLYRTQHIDDLYTFIEQEGISISQQTAFLDNRNKNWIPTISSILENQSAFIALGAAHLGGPNGVVRLLQKEGYKVTPIKL